MALTRHVKHTPHEPVDQMLASGRMPNHRLPGDGIGLEGAYEMIRANCCSMARRASIWRRSSRPGCRRSPAG